EVHLPVLPEKVRERYLKQIFTGKRKVERLARVLAGAGDFPWNEENSRLYITHYLHKQSNFIGNHDMWQLNATVSSLHPACFPLALEKKPNLKGDDEQPAWERFIDIYEFRHQIHQEFPS